MDGIGVILFLALIFGPFVGVGFGIGWAVRGRRDRKSLALGMNRFKRQDALVDRIQRDAYEHMVLDPASPLPVIIIDSIRNSEAEERREIDAAGVEPMAAEPTSAPGAKKVPFINLSVANPARQEAASAPVSAPVIAPVIAPSVVAPPVTPAPPQPQQPPQPQYPFDLTYRPSASP